MKNRSVGGHMDVLVTGGSGAIGTFVAEELTRRDHTVTVFDVTKPESTSGSYVRGDVTAEEEVADAVEGADVIVHMASLLPPACQADPQRAVRVNITGTLNVFSEAISEGCSVIYVSSKAVFGPITGVHAHPTYEPLGEDMQKSPTTVYGTTKYTCEQLLASYRQQGLDAAAIRFASTYGPGKGDEHGNLALISEAIERAAEGEDVSLRGGDQLNDFIYYGDIANGIADMIDATPFDYAAYHIGSGSTTSLWEFAEALEERTSATVTVEGGLNFYGHEEPTYCRLDISRAKSDAGYDPEFAVSAAVGDYLDRL